MKKNRFKKEGSPENVLHAFSQLDELRVEALNELKDILEIHDEILKLEQRRLSKKYDPNHLRVIAMQERLEYNTVMFKAYDEVIMRSSANSAPSSAGSWAVEGYVYDNNRKPANGFTIFLSDSELIRIKEAESAITDDTGYFMLSIDKKLVSQLEKQTIFLNVSERGKKILYTDNEPLFPKSGVINQRDIFLSDETKSPSDSKRNIG